MKAPAVESCSTSSHGDLNAHRVENSQLAIISFRRYVFEQ